MRRALILGVFVAVVLPLPALSQTTGYPPFGSFSKGQFASVNNTNLNIVFGIPVMSSPGRGLNLGFNIAYNSLSWVPSNGAWVPTNPNNPYAPWGWLLTSVVGQTASQFTITYGTCGRQGQGYTQTTTYTGFEYVDPMGTPHPFNLFVQDVYSSCTNQDTWSGTYSGYATDASGFYASIANPANDLTPVITSKSGTVISTESLTITDANGNYLSATGNGSETDWKDTVGRTALKIISGSSTVLYKFLDPTGGFQTTTVNLSSFNIKTNFGCYGVSEYTGTANLPTSIVLPNSQTYTISYEPTPGHSGYYTGRIQKISFPTGGYYQYAYGATNDGVSCVDGSGVNMTETVSADSGGTNSATWTYLRTTGAGGTATVTTPALPDIPNSFDTVYSVSGAQVTTVKVYKESPGVNVLRTGNTTWASNGTPQSQVTILEDGSTQSEVDTTYDSNGLLDSVTEYDWGSGAHGSKIRTTNLTYQTSSNYTSRNILGLVTSKQILDGGGTVQYRQDIAYDGYALTTCPTGVAQHNDTAYGCSFNYRGNPTSVTTYQVPSGPSGGITKTFSFDFFGNLLTAQVNCCQVKSWTYSATTKYSTPDSVISGTSPGPTLQTSYTYNSSTGQVLTTTDPNNLVTTVTYDTLRRPLSISQANGSTTGGSVSYSYNDSAFTVKSTTSIDSSNSLVQIVGVDGLGRPNISTTEDASSNIYSKASAVYDLIGRPYQSYNPYTGSSGSYYTTAAFDVLGRPTSVTSPDGSSKSSYSYSAQAVTVTDAAGNARKSISDAAGRLVSVYEPDPNNGNSLTVSTSYAYNVFDELTSVSQGSQTRTYNFDPMGRLTSTTIPEGGTTCFGTVSGSTCNSSLAYDSFNNLLQRTDARGVQTTFSYDALNRPTGVSYSVGSSGVTAPANVCDPTGGSNNTASVCFVYGTSTASFNNGLLITMKDTVGSESYSYNALEQMTQLQKVISSTTYTTNYSSNLAGELTQITYPSGRVVTMPVDAIGRLCAVGASGATCSSGTTYATGFTYNPAGQVTAFGYGNGLFASFGFASDTLQLNCIDYSTTNRSGSGCAHDGTTKFGLSYSYPAAGGNNGMISGITDSAAGGRSVNFSYDPLLRLSQAVSTGDSSYPKWGLAMTYDRYGNRSAQSIATTTPASCVAPMTCPTNSVTVSATTNQITGSPYLYDANGNMTNDGINSLFYDVENHVIQANGTLGTCSTSSACYTIDGNGMRVKKAVTGGTTTVYIFSGSKVVAEYDNGAAPGSPSREYIYSGGALLAKIDSTGTKYYHQDHLSNRMVTDSSGNVAAQMGHFPYGESWYNTASDKLMFTTYERDAETGNDYAQARSHVNRLGRFSSLDPVAGSIGDPQTLNRYAYVRNMPTMAMDPSGAHSCFPAASNIEEKGRDASVVSGHSPEDFIEGAGADSDLEQLGSGVTRDANTGDCASWGDQSMGWGAWNSAVSLPDGLLGGSDANTASTQAYTPNDPRQPIYGLPGLSAGGPDGAYVSGIALERDCVGSTTTVIQPDGTTSTQAGGSSCASYPYITFNWVSGAAGVAMAAAVNASWSGNSAGWWTTLGKSALSNAISARFYQEELQPGGCLNTMLGGMEKADILGPYSSGNQNTVETVAQLATANAAYGYAAGRALTVPLRSSVFRGILATGETATGAFAPAYFDVQAGVGVFTEAQAAFAGTCH